MEENEMKKILAVAILLVTLCFCLTGCMTIGNRQVGLDLTQSFTWAIVELGNGELIEGKVTSWRDFDESDVVQLTMNGVTYLTHYSKVILCTSKP